MEFNQVIINKAFDKLTITYFDFENKKQHDKVS
jgi:hypothetical protein